MKPFGLFVLPFYQIGRSFSNNFTMSKSIQNRHKRYSFGIVKRYSAMLFPMIFSKERRFCLSSSGCWESGFVRQRRSAICLCGKLLSSTKFPRVPCGQTFDRPRFALPFRSCRKAEKTYRNYIPSVGILYRYVGEHMGNTTLPVPVHPCHKGVCCKQKNSGGITTNENSGHLCQIFI